MTGMVYRQEQMGALPVGHYRLMNLEHINVQDAVSLSYDTMLHIYPDEHVDYAVLSDGEKEILGKVIAKW